MADREERHALADNRKRGWFWDYNDVFSSSLSEHAIVVRLYLARCANKNQEAWPSLNTITRNCKISKPTVIKAIRELESQGWIRRVVHKNNDEYENTVYYLEDPPENPAGCESSGADGGGKASLPPGKNEGVVKQVDHLVNTVDYPGKAGLPGVVKPVDPNNTHITIPIKGQQQRMISDHGSIVDWPDYAKNVVVVDQSTHNTLPEPGEKQAASPGAEKTETAGLTGKPAMGVEKQEEEPASVVAEIMNYAANKGIDISEDCARDFLAAGGSIDRAIIAVDRAAVSALSKVRRGEQIHNPAGLLFKALGFNSGAKLDLKNLDSERKKRLAEKEDKYKDIYLS